MTRFVIDASVAVEYLLKTTLGLTVANTIDSASLVAPELMDAEVLSLLRAHPCRLKECRNRAGTPPTGQECPIPQLQ